MSFDFSSLRIDRMLVSDLDDVLAIEQSVYSHPWNRTSFVSSLNNHDDAWVVRADTNAILGYLVQMLVVDEIHLLAIAVDPGYQQRGLGKILLNFALRQAENLGARAMLLEVRESNSRALRLYQSAGFEQIGQRKNYYQRNQQQRENALIMRREIPLPVVVSNLTVPGLTSCG